MQTEQIISTAVGIGLAILLGWLQERGKKKSRQADRELEQAALLHDREKLLSEQRVPWIAPDEPEIPPVPLQARQPATAETLPEEGVRTTSAYEQAAASAPQTPAPGSSDSAAVEEHRRRWRRAIIDSQILTPKF